MTMVDLDDTTVAMNLTFNSDSHDSNIHAIGEVSLPQAFTTE